MKCLLYIASNIYSQGESRRTHIGLARCKIRNAYLDRPHCSALWRCQFAPVLCAITHTSLHSYDRRPHEVRQHEDVSSEQARPRYPHPNRRRFVRTKGGPLIKNPCFSKINTCLLYVSKQEIAQTAYRGGSNRPISDLERAGRLISAWAKGIALTKERKRARCRSISS